MDDDDVVGNFMLPTAVGELIADSPWNTFEWTVSGLPANACSVSYIWENHFLKKNFVKFFPLIVKNKILCEGVRSHIFRATICNIYVVCLYIRFFCFFKIYTTFIKRNSTASNGSSMRRNVVSIGCIYASFLSFLMLTAKENPGV